MIKVAICLSGFPRTTDYSLPYLKRYISDPLNADIFFYGYSDINNNLSKEYIVEKYNLKRYVIREFTPEIEKEIWENYGTSEVKHKNGNISVINILSQYYNLFKSNELKKDHEKELNFKYDIVIRARTDYYFYREFTQEELNIEPNTVYIPNIWDFGGVSSGFAYGNSESMDIYSNFFNKIKEYNLQDNQTFHPERLKAHHINRSGLIRQVVKNHYWWDLSDFNVNGCKDSYIEGLTTNPNRRNYK